MARRRQVVVHAGLLAMAFATACAASACIFEEGEYKGGGRLGRAATARQEKPDAGPDDTPTTTRTTPTALPDAGIPGG